jgi:hypothetical protein
MEMWPIVIADVKLARNVKMAIQRQVNGQSLLDYWTSKGKFGSLSYDQVQWIATEKALDALPHSRRPHQIKMISTFVAVRRRLKLRQYSEEIHAQPVLCKTHQLVSKKQYSISFI